MGLAARNIDRGRLQLSELRPAMTSRPCIRLRLLGRFALGLDGDVAPIRLSTRKSGALLAFLATSPE